MKTLYTAHATTTAGRQGYTETDDKAISTKLSKPASGETGTNPEQLFACGYSACFGSAVEAVAKKHNANPKEIKVEAKVSLNQDDDGFYLSVLLNAILTGVADDNAKTIVKEAHQMCPYSKATRGNIDVKISANGKEIA